MKKVISILLALMVLILPAASFAGTDRGFSVPEGFELQGFSYDMSGDSSTIEEGFFANGKLLTGPGEKAIIITESNVLDGEVNGAYHLEDMGDDVYQAQISEDRFIILDLTSEPMIDIIEKGNVFAFGGDRLEKVAEILDASKAEAECITLKEGVQRNLKAVNRGQIASAENSKLLARMFYDRQDSSQISFSIQTKGNQAATKVLRVTLDGDTNSVLPTWTNPSGTFHGSGVDWANSIMAVANNIVFFLPVYTSGTAGATYGNAFQFDVKMNANWNEMRGRNAAVFVVGLKREPNTLRGCGGDVNVIYRISTVGSFDASIGVYV